MWYSDHFEAKKVLRREKRCWEKKTLQGVRGIAK
jgi:hypothetical protein